MPWLSRREKFPMEFRYLRQFLPDAHVTPCGNVQIKRIPTCLGSRIPLEPRPWNEMSLTLVQHLLRMVKLFGPCTRIEVLALLVLYLFWVWFVQNWLVDRTSRTHILPYPGCGTMRVLAERERTKWTIKKHRNFANDCWRNTKS